MLMVGYFLYMKQLAEAPNAVDVMVETTVTVVRDEVDDVATGEHGHRQRRLRDTSGNDDEVTEVLDVTKRVFLEPPETNLVNMVVTYPYMLDYNDTKYTRQQLEIRQNEFTDTIWRNLHHERVWSIHILYEQKKHVIYLVKQLRSIARGKEDKDFEKVMRKLYLFRLRDGEIMQYKEAFEYANKYLSGTFNQSSVLFR